MRHHWKWVNRFVKRQRTKLQQRWKHFYRYQQYREQASALRLDQLEPRVLLSADALSGVINLSEIISQDVNGALIQGANAGDYAGRSISSAGDVNGDGYDDILIGAPNADYNGSYSGDAYLLYGSAQGLPTQITLSDIADGLVEGAIFRGIEAADSMGLWVASAGDVNGDGLADILISSLHDEFPSSSAGTVYLVYGQQTGLTGLIDTQDITAGEIAGAAFVGVGDDDYAGDRVSAAGDVNDDGYDDFLISTYGVGQAPSNEGAVYLIYGQETEFTGTNQLSDIPSGNLRGSVFVGENEGDRVGSSLSAAGDVNGDGYDDFLIGAYKVDTSTYQNGEGEVYLIYGQADDFADTNDLSDIHLGTLDGAAFRGTARNERLGFSVASAGDVDGDGFTDLLLASHPYVTGIEDYQPAQVFLVYGQASGLAGTIELADAAESGLAVARFTGSGYYESNPLTVSSAGDVDGDGYADMLIGAPFADPDAGYSAGRAYLIYGNEERFEGLIDWQDISDNTLNGVIFNGTQAGGFAGDSVASAGDINGDGLSDILIGAVLNDVNVLDNGEVFLVHGIARQSSISGHLWIDSDTDGIEHTSEQRIAGARVNLLDNLNNIVDFAYTDLNGDYFFTGLADGDYQIEFVLPYGYTFTTRNADNDDKLDSDADTQTGLSPSVTLANNLQARNISAGLIPEQLVGNDDQLDGALGLEGVLDGTLDGAQFNGALSQDRAGWDVSNAGDINGDGFDDFLIVADDARVDGVFDTGLTYLIYGQAAGLTGSIDLADIATGRLIGAQFIDGEPLKGSLLSVAAAGDVNGDGYADMLISDAEYRNAENVPVGRTFLVYGQASGLYGSINLSDIAVGSLAGAYFAGDDPYDYAGVDIASAGDINGDGYDDFLIGTSGASTDEFYRGKSYLIYGQTTANGGGLSGGYELSDVVDGTLAGAVFYGPGYVDGAGLRVSSAGDVNGDQYDDLLISAQYTTVNGQDAAGMAYLVYGKQQQFDGMVNLLAISIGTVDGSLIFGAQAEGWVGESVAAAGDVDGDGYDDILIGAAGQDVTGNNNGRLFLLYGQQGGLGQVVVLSNILDGYQRGAVFDGTNENAYVGRKISSAGDVNGDGYDDFLVGVRWADDDGLDPVDDYTGQTYLIYGKASGITGIHDLTEVTSGTLDGAVFNGINELDLAGAAVSWAGDVNADGFADLLIGAWAANGHTGKAYLIYGQGTLPTPDQNVISGTVWLDEDEDGLLDMLENGVSEIHLDLLDVNGNVLQSTVTDASGFYVFNDIADGTYRLQFNLPEDYHFTDANVGADDNRDSDADIDTGITLPFFVHSSQHKSNVYAGLIVDEDDPPVNDESSIGGHVWVDRDNRGIEDESEFRKANVQVFLLDKDKNTLASTYTDANGAYLFENLDAETYYIQFGLPDGYQFTTLNYGFDDDVDSDAHPVTGVTLYPIYLAAQTHVGNVSAGLIFEDDLPPEPVDYDNSFSGQLWLDENANGIMDESEQAITGIRVNVLNEAGRIIRFAYTDLDGQYTIENITPGNQQIQFVLPHGYEFTSQDAGADDALDSDADATGHTSQITIGETDKIQNVSAGLLIDPDVIDDSPLFGDFSLADFADESLWGATLSTVDSQSSRDMTTANVGDVNGDGYDDFLVGVKNAGTDTAAKCGMTYLIYGQSSGLTASIDLEEIITGSILGAVFYGEDSTDFAGGHLAGAGDVNNDGFADFLISAYSKPVDGVSNVGRTYLIYGQADALYGELELSDIATGQLAGAYFNGIDRNDFSSISITSAGDVNGDGCDDILIGSNASTFSTDSIGEAYLIYGQTSGLEGANDLADIAAGTLQGMVIASDQESDRAGYQVSSAGDVDGDGFDDLLVSAINADANELNNSGQVFLIYGQADHWDNTISLSQIATGDVRGTQFNGTELNAYAGSAIASAGDVDGDGFDDILIGSYGAAVNGYQSGQVCLVFGQENGFDSVVDISDITDGSIRSLVINGSSMYQYVGTSISTAGDVNADGCADILIGVQNANSTVGRTYLIYGHAGLTGTFDLDDIGNAPLIGAVFYGDPTTVRAGAFVSSAGDVNADGVDDLLISASGDSSHDSHVYLIYGKGPEYAVYNNALAGKAWLDSNHNGIIDPTESQLAGITVNLVDNQQNIIRTTVTDEQGAYAFNALAAGQYHIAFVTSQNTVVTLMDQAEDEHSDSDVDPQTGMTDVLMLGVGQTVTGLNVGVFNPLPVADAGDAYVMDEGQSVTLDASATTDFADEVLTYAWDLDNDGAYDDAIGVSPTISWQTLFALGLASDGSVLPIGLQVTDDAGSVTTTTTLTINNLAPVVAAGGAYVMDEGQSLTLDATGTTDAGDTTLSYVWDLDNDGVYDDAVGQSATISWQTLKSLGLPSDGSASTISLKVTDDTGSVSVNTTLTINNLAPVVDDGGAYALSEGQTLQLDASATKDAGGDALAYAWDLDNDGEYDDAIGISPSISWQSLMSLGLSVDGSANPIGLQVTDDLGQITTSSTTLTLTNLPPDVDAGGVYVIDEGQSVTLDASDSTDPGDSLLTYAWDLDNDGEYDDAFGESPVISWQSLLALGFPSDGTAVPIGLKVTDDTGLSATAGTTLTINNVLPTVDAGDAYVMDEGQSLSLDASGTTDAADTSLTYAWDLDNDGAYDDAFGISPTISWQTLVSLGLTSDGSVLPISLQVTDDTGSVTSSTTLTINNLPPVIDAVGEYIIDEGQSLTLDATATDAGDTSLTYAWDLDNDGEYDDAIGNTPTISWQTLLSLGLVSDGSVLPIGLQVSDDAVSVTTSTTLTINNAAPNVITANDYVIDEGQSLTLDATDTSDAGDTSLTYAWDLDNDGVYDDAFGVAPTIAWQTLVSLGLASDGSVLPISLQVSDDTSSVTADTTLTINNIAPLVNSGGPYIIDEHQSLSLNASQTTDAGDDTLTYAWDLDNDGVFDDAFGSQPTLDWQTLDAMTLQSDGIALVIQLKVTDDTESVTVWTTLAINNLPPIVDAGDAYVIDEGQSVTLDASGTVDATGDYLTYKWDLDNDGLYDDAMGISPTLSWNELVNLGLSSDGAAHTIGLRVYDELGATASATTTLTINNLSPEVDAGDGYETLEGYPVVLDQVDYWDPDFRDNAIFSWDLDNDGFFDDAYGFEPTISWETLESLGLIDGEYTITLMVHDTEGGVDFSSTTLHVQRLATVNALVWQDTNSNGVWDTDEAILPGINVNLLDTNGEIVDTAQSDAEGKVSFLRLHFGSYRLEVTPQTGWQATAANVGSDETRDSDLHSDTSLSDWFVLSETYLDQSLTVGLRNPAPGADAGELYAVAHGQSMELNAAGSVDANGDVLSYAWDLDQDGQFDDAIGVNPTLTYAQMDALGWDIGQYQITLQVTDSQGNTATDTATVMVQQPVTGGTVNLSDAEEGLLYGAVFVGDTASSSSKRQIASAGDVNGDGLMDFLIGEYSDDTVGENNGSVYLIYGRTSGFVGNVDLSLAGTAALPGAVFHGNELGMSAGYSVAAAGDVDNDGYDDFLIGAPYADVTDNLGDNSGAVYLIYGDASLTGEYQLAEVSDGNLDGAVLYGLYSGNELGRNIASAGDVNGDGFDDLLIGNQYVGEYYGVYGSAGAAYLIYGGQNRMAGEYNVSEVGTSNLPGATFNGVGKYYASTSGYASIYSASDYEIMERVGYSVSGAGDFNGDGYADILLGTAPSGVSTGRAYMIYGAADGLNGTFSVSDVYWGNLAGEVFVGASSSDSFGTVVASAGDVNGDGYGDLIFGARRSGSSEQGRAYLVYGRAEELSVQQTISLNSLSGLVTFTGADYDVHFGANVATAGDINGDGFDDLLITAPADGFDADDNPKTYLVYGHSQDLPSVVVDHAISDGSLRGAIINEEKASRQVIALGDVNGDGMDDLMLSTNGLNAEATTSVMKSSLLYGSASGQISGTAWKDANNNGIQDPDEITLADIQVTLLDEQGNELAQTYTDTQGQYDFSLLSVGDYQVHFATPWSYQFTDANQGQDDSVDSDADVSTGYTHWINLDYGQDVQNIDAGYQRIADPLIANSLEGLIGLSQVAPGVLQGTVFHGAESYDQIGYNVSSAGDVDGDGYEDFLFTNKVSSSSYPLGVDRGKTYLIYGNADGWQTEVDINGDTTLQVRGAVIYSQTVGLESGEYVSSAGDVNNDGYDDILIRSSFTYGSSYYHMTTYSKTYLIYGKAGGVTGDVSLDNLSASGLHWAVFEDGGTNSNAGQRVATVGDVNGDGYDDFLIGAYDISDSDTWSPEAGKTYLVYGKASYYNGEYQLESIVGGSLNGAIFNGISSYDQAGYSVAAAGDVNGDGFMDLLINSLGGADVQYAGESYLIYGSQDGLHGNLELYKLRNGDLPGAIFTGVHSWDNAGLSLASAGDVNGDGLADLILGASGADPNGAGEGQVYLIYGSRTLLNGQISLEDVLDGAIPGAVFNGTQPNDQVGKAVASAGDVNGDGYDDLLIGASSADAFGPGSSGMTYLVYGKAVGLSGVFNLSEIQSGDLDGAIFAGNGSGYSVASAGDVNQDGLDDMLIGTPYADTNADNAGSVYLIYGQYAYGINTASVTGTVWDDADQNGIRSEDESTIAGISVSLVNVHGYAIKTTTTDAQGNYDFDHVAAGEYQVAINVTDGRIGTQIHQGADDTVDSDVQSVSVTTPLFTLEHAQAVTSLDAGLTVAGSISGVITDDYNEDGMPNPDEPTIAGVTVYLDTNGNDSLDWTDINGNAIWDSGEGERWTQSNEQGEYLFDRLLAGSYAVRQIVPQGYVQTGPEPGSTTTITQRVSLSETGDQVNGSSSQVDMSADGRFVVFSSTSSRLVAGDSNSTSDVFLVDTVTDTIKRISVSPDGQQGNAYSNSASISDDGRYVVYISAASNLVDDDTNGYVDIFVYDRLTEQTKRINTLPDGTQANRSSDDPVISGDGRYIAFESTASNLASGTSLSVNEIYIFDQETGALTFMDIALDDTQKNRGYNDPSISADGRYVTFWSTKSNLVADDTNEIPDVFVHDRQTGQTRLVSISNEGVQANNAGYDPVISPDGRYVAFYSSANNLVADDTGNTADIFVYDLQSDQIKRITVNAQGDQANRSSYSPTFSADGRYVAFRTLSTNLLYGQSTQSSAGIVVYDQLAGDFAYVSQSNDGQHANDYAYDPAISADGSTIVYSSRASNLISDDTNDQSDIYMTRWAIGERLVSLDLGQNVTDINWANAKNGSIGDRVWLDLNRDGVQDASEVGVANVTVNLLDDQQNVIETTITNEQGDYLFSHLAAGDYIVQFVLEDGHTFTSTQGSNDATDSDADAITGLTDVLTLQANQHVDNIDAGIVSSGSITGRIWNDHDDDSLFYYGDTILQNVTVHLLDDQNQVAATTVTDADGKYAFNNLEMGDYHVHVPLPNGFLYAQHQDIPEDLDSDSGSRTIRILARENEPGTITLYLPAGQLRLEDQMFVDDYEVVLWQSSAGNGIQVNTSDAFDRVDLSWYQFQALSIPATYTYRQWEVDLDGDSDIDVRINDGWPGGYTGGGGISVGGSNDGGIFVITGDSNLLFYAVTADPSDNQNNEFVIIGNDPIWGYPFPPNYMQLDPTTGNSDTITLSYGDMIHSVDAGLVNPPPTADAGDGYELYPGDSVTLDASGSTDLNSDTLTYAWDLDDDGVFDDALGINPQVDWATLYDLQLTDGAYVIGMRVTDSMGNTDTAYSTITVYQPDLLGQITFADITEHHFDSQLISPVDNASDVGSTLTPAGDINGDGFGDWLVAVPSDQSEYNDVYLIYGENGMNAESIQIEDVVNGQYDTARFIGQTELGDQYMAVAPAADFNSDGFDDLYLTLFTAEGTPLQTHVLYGHAASIAGYVWDDVNNNGYQNDVESAFADVTVHLLDEQGNVLQTTQTDDAGQYTFSGLFTGDYTVSFDLPQYYRFALQHQTMAADRDSDVHTQTGQAQVTIASSHQDASVDAGMLDPNHAPQAAPNFVVVDYQQATDIDVLSNDYDADGDFLVVSQLSGETTARGASITINDDNTIHYDPSGLFDALEPGQKIRDRFRYEVTDAWGKSDTHIVFVDVRRPLASENQGNEGQGDDGVVIVAQSTPPRFIAVSGISSDPFDIASFSQVDRVALAWLSQQASMSVVPQAGSSLATQQPWLTALLDNHDDQKGQFNWRLTQTADEQSV